MKVMKDLHFWSGILIIVASIAYAVAFVVMHFQREVWYSYVSVICTLLGCAFGAGWIVRDAQKGARCPNCGVTRAHEVC